MLFGKTRAYVDSAFQRVQVNLSNQVENTHLSDDVHRAYRRSLSQVDALKREIIGYLDSLERDVLETLGKH